jgi:hypothetical protein
VEDEDVAITQQLRDLDLKVDDIRSSVAQMAVVQATQSGETKVLTAKLEGFEERIEPRLEALESERKREQWQAWAERLGAAIVGAASLELARLLSSGR